MRDKARCGQDTRNCKFPKANSCLLYTSTKHIVNKHIVSFVKKSIDIEPHVTLGSRDACINALFTGSILSLIHI